ncbi:MAG: hypothetical protein AAF634_05585 [Bacteroidota bacterium]
MTIAVGEEIERQVLAEWPYYRWIYDKVLNDERARAVNIKFCFNILR